MSAVWLNGNFYGKHHSIKKQLKAPEKNVGGCVGLQHLISSLVLQILSCIAFCLTMEHERFAINQAITLRTPSKKMS